MVRALARWILRVGGWTAVGGVPDAPKAVIVFAPHTSNWDGLWALTYKVSIGADIRFLAKHSLFWFPLGTLLNALGGIKLDRRRAQSAVQQAVDMFEQSDSMYLGLAPEGTRSLKPGWKKGFLRIADGAGVPLYLAFIDYSNKRVGIGPRVDLSGDQTADLQRLNEFYADIQARWPEQKSPIRFN